MKRQLLVGAAAVLMFAAFVPATVFARGFGGYHGSAYGGHYSGSHEGSYNGALGGYHGGEAYGAVGGYHPAAVYGGAAYGGAGLDYAAAQQAAVAGVNQPVYNNGYPTVGGYGLQTVPGDFGALGGTVDGFRGFADGYRGGYRFGDFGGDRFGGGFRGGWRR